MYRTLHNLESERVVRRMARAISTLRDEDGSRHKFVEVGPAAGSGR